MEPPRTPGPSDGPAAHPEPPAERLPSRFEPPLRPPPPSRSSHPRARLWPRSLRGAVGAGIVGAALLLFPFQSDLGRWWVPVGLGVGTLALLTLVRLDRLLGRWTWHIAGLVLVAGLMYSTGPWAWAMAASIAVLIAGLLRLPAWKVAAVGVALCVGSGLGYGISTMRTAEQIAAQHAQTQLQNRGQLGAPRPAGVLPVLLNSIARGESAVVCNLLTEPARAPFAASVGQPDCVSAVHALAAQITAPGDYAEAQAPSVPSDDGVTTVDACRMTWRTAAPAGPQLGRLLIGRTTGPTYFVLAFAPC
ncbi:hypothetical protein ACFQE5_17525 [Pseudonocardia hispaniensis]|uniref:Uncharacterized protein n=1 Tax=Pseudonocardia hispaniensis TaxID=904933 RepID=A0ABW1J661_9PSEU